MNKKLICIITLVILLSLTVVTNAAVFQDRVINYTVQRGDTLWLISDRYSTSIQGIRNLNNISGDNIFAGGNLRVPVNMNPLIRNVSYRVKAGDTLSLLSEYFGTTIDSIRSANNIQGTMIYVGQTLNIRVSYINYVVSQGDTLWRIATRYGTTIEKIRMFNNEMSTMIYPDQVIRIPYFPQARSVSFINHSVKSGESAWSISIRYGIPQQELLNVNGLTLTSVLSIGQVLRIPVYSIPVKHTPGPQYGEYLDWWTEAQYLFPIGSTALVRDFETGRVFYVKRSIGANHADCEPLTANDTAVMRSLWGGTFSWVTRAVTIEIGGRKMAASVSSMPHGIQYIENNNFNGHFDIHFKNSTRHVDGAIDTSHQSKIKVAAGVR